MRRYFVKWRAADGALRTGNVVAESCHDVRVLVSVREGIPQGDVITIERTGAIR